MAKKNKKQKASTGSSGGRNYTSSGDLLEKVKFHTECRVEAAQKVAPIQHLSLEGQKDEIRRILVEIGTDVDRNDGDPIGDGDQSIITCPKKCDIARHLWCAGGDISVHLRHNVMSVFALGCMAGCVKNIKTIFHDKTKGESKPWSTNKNVASLLETRESSMRLSPLLLIVSVGKTITCLGPSDPNIQQHREMAKFLLRNGASPVAKDVMGRTVCHYGAGAMATEMTLDVVDMCIEAGKSHCLHGKQVELYGLKTQEMNGRMGIAGGFDFDLKRRCVFMPEEKKEIWIKVENMKLALAADLPKCLQLTDVLDRLGTISLHEVVIKDKVDVAKFLLERHQTSIHTKEMGGISPFEMVVGMDHSNLNVTSLIMDAARREGREATKVKKQSKRCCGYCEHYLGCGGAKCAQCKVTNYCGRECQLAHWDAHKKECKDLAALLTGVKLDPPNKLPMGRSIVNKCFNSGSIYHYVMKYQKPSNCKFGEKFVVKVQATVDSRPVLVYDQTRECMFEINPGKRGFLEILAAVRKEKAWQGQKTFMKALFDQNATCTIYPGTAGVKSHYTW